jgi:hypothetical protein
MSINNSAKIFIDVDDEINFVVEKILGSESSRVIIVVPQNAIIVSSLVSMKILAKQIVKSKKLAILVTEDKFGLQIAHQAGITAVTKVSAITPELWESAQIAKEKAKSKLKELKDDLLANRGIGVPEALEAATVIENMSEAEDSAPEVIATEAIAAVEAKPEDEETENSDIISTQEPEDKAEIENSKSETTEESEIGADTKSEPEAEKVQGPIQRPRREAKMVELSGFQIYAGGDIANLNSKSEGESKMDDNLNQTAEEEGGSSRNVDEAKVKGGFTGRDWTRYTATTQASNFSLSNLWPFKPKREPGEITTVQDPETARKRRRTIIIAVLIGFVVLFFGGGYLMAFQFSQVDLRITLKKAEVPINQQISADTALTALDADKLVLPAKEIMDDTLSISASDNTTGTGKKGNVAAGVIDIWNKCLQATQTLKAGTILTNETTNLNYKLRQDVTIEGVKKPCGDPSNTVVQVQDVPIEAEKFGTEYNISDLGTGEQVNFKVAGYKTTDMEAKRFKNITGGTTESFQATSQADVDRVKTPLVERLKEQGVRKLANLVPTGYRLIEGTQEFNETKETATPAVGEEGTSFSLSLEGKMTALIVAEADLETGIGLVVKNNQQLDADFELGGLGDVVIGDVKRTGQKVSFTVASKGSIQSKVTEDDLKNALVGKSMDAANDYLVNVKEIESFKLTFSPSFIPDSIKRIPSADRIKVTFK